MQSAINESREKPLKHFVVIVNNRLTRITRQRERITSFLLTWTREEGVWVQMGPSVAKELFRQSSPSSIHSSFSSFSFSSSLPPPSSLLLLLPSLLLLSQGNWSFFFPFLSYSFLYRFSRHVFKRLLKFLIFKDLKNIKGSRWPDDNGLIMVDRRFPELLQRGLLPPGGNVELTENPKIPITIILNCLIIMYNLTDN